MSSGTPAPLAFSAQRWVLLVYTVPATPSRKRAAVWREVKRLGALYLRDGVCALPDTEAARGALTALAERVQRLEGQAVLVAQARLSEGHAIGLATELARARQAEYAEIATAATALVRHLEREATHRALGRSDLAALDSDLRRLERWFQQARARDYLEQGDGDTTGAALAACRTALAAQAASVS